MTYFDLEMLLAEYATRLDHTQDAGMSTVANANAPAAGDQLTAPIAHWVEDPREQERIAHLAAVTDLEDALYEEATAALDRGDDVTAERLLTQCVTFEIGDAEELLEDLYRGKVHTVRQEAHTERRPNDLHREVAALTKSLAFVTAVGLTYQRQIREYEARIQQLLEVLDTRTVVEQAKGILAAKEGISLEQAFSEMRKTARRENIRLREIAMEIVKEVHSHTLLTYEDLLRM